MGIRGAAEFKYGALTCICVHEDEEELLKEGRHKSMHQNGVFGFPNIKHHPIRISPVRTHFLETVIVRLKVKNAI